MVLKKWNSIQCKIFKEEGISDTIEVYKMASMISNLRKLDDEEEIIRKAREIINKYRLR